MLIATRISTPSGRQWRHRDEIALVRLGRRPPSVAPAFGFSLRDLAERKQPVAECEQSGHVVYHGDWTGVRICATVSGE
jgi:hypothetical protein